MNNNSNIIIEYIKKGLNCDFSLIRQYSIILSVLFLSSTLYIFMSKDITITIISIIMQIISLITILFVFRVTSGQYTIKKRLLLNLYFPLLLSLNFIFFSVVLYLYEFGYNGMLFALCLSPICCAVLFYVMSNIRLKYFLSRKVVLKQKKRTIYKVTSGICTLGVLGGFFGKNFARIFLKDTRISSSLIIIIPFVIVSCVLTISVCNITKLRCIEKLLKMGIDLDNTIKSGVHYSD